MTIAQGKAAEAAALGKEPPRPISFSFWFGAPEARQTRRKKRTSFCYGNPERRFACPGPLSIALAGLGPGLASLAKRPEVRRTGSNNVNREAELARRANLSRHGAECDGETAIQRCSQRIVGVRIS